MTDPVALHTAEATLEAVHTRRHDAYPEYRPSGIEWLGDVPEHWDVKRLKYVASINDEALPEITDPEYEFDYVDIGNVNSTHGIIAKERLVFEDAPSRARRVVREGDTIVSTVRTYLRAIAPVREAADNLIVSTGFAVVRPREIDPAFLSFALRDSHFVETVVSESTGVSYPAINASEVGRISVPVPPLEEQRGIARFLDEQTGKIDHLIGAKRDLLDLLREKRQAVITHAVTKGLDPAAKLKPSGVEWLGDVPEHWDVPPLYARYDSVLGKMLDEKRITGTLLVPYLRNVDVQWDRINTTDLPEMDIDPSDYERFTVREGDLLVCEGGEVGRCAIWQNQQHLCGFQKAIHRVRAKSPRDIPRFLFYVLRCAASFGAFIAGSNPNTIPHLTGEKLRRHRFPMPPPEEQRAIVRFLDGEMARMDELEAVVREAISSLESLRTSIISAAVTGKIDVRGEGL